MHNMPSEKQVCSIGDAILEFEVVSWEVLTFDFCNVLFMNVITEEQIVQENWWANNVLHNDYTDLV